MSIVKRNGSLYIRYRDEHGRQHFVKGLSHKTLTERMERKILDEVAAKKAGVWVAPVEVAKLSAKLSEYESKLREDGCTPLHVQNVAERLRRIIEACHLNTLRDIRPEPILRYIRSLTVSPRTRNHYRANCLSFLKWQGVALILPRADERAERAHDRRALTLEEMRSLITATRESSWVWRGMNGRDRATLYLTAIGTGFRSSELAALTSEDLDLDGKPPVAVLPARFTKNGETAIQPLPSEVVKALRGKVGVLFPGKWVTKAVEMIRHDLAAAGIAYSVPGPNGPLYADFHALRHSYITNVVETAPNLRDAQRLARHSTISLTVDRYGRHVQLSRLAETVAALPIAGEQPALTTKEARA